MAESNATGLDESRLADKKQRRQDWIICGLGVALAILAKFIA